MLVSFRSFNCSLLESRDLDSLHDDRVFVHVFEVLDLNGSNFPTHRGPVQIAAAKVPKVETDVTRWQLPG